MQHFVEGFVHYLDVLWSSVPGQKYIFIMDKAPSPSLAQGSIFRQLAFIFKRHGIRCVLVGGYAVNAHKVQRMTFDIDFMVSLSDYAKIERDLLDLGYSIFSRQDNFIQMKTEKHGLRDLDFLIGDVHTIDELVKEGRTFDIAGEAFVIPSPLHLIAMKLHSMAGNAERERKDLPDVIQLMMVNSIDPGKEEIKAMFLRYKAEHLYDRVLGELKART